MTVRRILLVLVLVGGGARIFWVAHAGIAPKFVSDPGAYLLQGEAIAKGSAMILRKYSASTLRPSGV